VCVCLCENVCTSLQFIVQSIENMQHMYILSTDSGEANRLGLNRFYFTGITKYYNIVTCIHLHMCYTIVERI